MNIALLGPSGAGKGTQAELLCREHGLVSIATGELLRANLENRTALGLLARKYMDQCELVPDEVVDAMIEERLLAIAPHQPVLFNGCPRTVEQAAFLQELLEQSGRSLDAVLYLDTPREESLSRLTGRVVCAQCHARYNRATNPPRRPGVCDHCDGPLLTRLDDDAETVGRRLASFQRRIGPVLDYYTERGLLFRVQGSGSIEAVHAAVRSRLARRESVTAAPPRPAETVVKAKRPAPTPVVRGLLPPNVPMNIGLIGGPGSGKGTQAAGLVRAFHLVHIASGDLFRDNLKRDTRLGQLARTYMNRGELVPDDITEAMVEERLAQPDVREGFLLDGFPRTLAQAQALAEIVERHDRPLAAVLYIRVPDAVLVERLSGRWICRQCQTPFHQSFHPPRQSGVCDACGGALYQREDDTIAVATARLRTFHRQTEPVIDFYRDGGLLMEIDGAAAVDSVQDRVLAAVHDLIARAHANGEMFRTPVGAEA